MAETVTNELILEHLKAIQTQLAAIRTDISDIRQDNRAHRSMTTGLVQSENPHGNQIANLAVRLDRIERRLELREDA